MSYQGTYIPLKDFTGGYAGNYFPTSIKLNEAASLTNIVVLPNGAGFRSRYGSIRFSSQIDSATIFSALGYGELSTGSKYLLAVGNNKLYASGNGPTTSFSNVTGAVTIGADTLIGDIILFNNVFYVYRGDNLSTSDTPFKWTGSGNASATGGTPPAGSAAFTVNNRVFVYGVPGNLSTIYWSVLGNAEDWTSVGSGSATVGSLNDSQKIVGAAVLNTNSVLIFKQGATYQMLVTSAPFPIYSLFSTVGCVGRKASVTADGVVYWINQYNRMVSTDGSGVVKTYSTAADNIFNSLQHPELLCGFRQKGTDHDWIVWSSPEQNGQAIIWDLLHQCWLYCGTGYGASVAAVVPSTGAIYMNSYTSTTNGYIYTPNIVGAFYDDTYAANTSILWNWRSGWLGSDDLDKITQVKAAEVVFNTKASGSITVTYGYDFIIDGSSYSFAQTATSTEQLSKNTTYLTGRGNTFQINVQGNSATIDSQVNQIILKGKMYGQKVISAP